MSTNDLYCQKLELLTYIFATDSVGVCLLLLTQLGPSLKVEPPESTRSSATAEKQRVSCPRGGG